MLRRLYDWIIRLSGSPRAMPALAAVSFAESSFFPIPPDAMIIPMVLAQPQKAWRIATVAMVSSVIGGLFGYAIGYYLFETVGQWLIDFYGLQEGVATFRTQFNEFGFWIILVKGLTPIPYKIVTITSGFAGYDIWLFMLFSVIARGGRFFVLAFLLHRYGDRARTIIEERLGFWVTIAAIAMVIGIVAALYLF
jgi:membrane protein YqaA with SNARE-associated domain